MFDNLNSDTENPTLGAPSSLKPTEPNVWQPPATQVRTTPMVYSVAHENPLPPPPPLVRESAARERIRKRRVRSRRAGGEWAWVVIAAAMLGVVIAISMSVFLLLQVSQEEPEVLATAVAVLPTPVDARSDFGPLNSYETGKEITLNDGRSIVLQPWNGNERFTVLMMGLDRRPGEEGLAYRTDTMILVSLDPTTNSIGLLSIPRDLYVEIPGYQQLQRANSAMVLGELSQPGNGPQLAMQTIQYNLGMRVHEYVAVDFSTFVTVVDLIGGVDIDVPYDISDPEYPDMFYGYDPLYINAGLQHMNGATALKYARTRHGDSDFQRAQRQQQVLYAIRDRVLELDMLPQLIIQAPGLWNELSRGISTRLSLDQIIQLSWYLKDISDIHTGVIDERYTMGYMTEQGAAVLVPDRTQLGPLMVEVFGSNYSQ